MRRELTLDLHEDVYAALSQQAELAHCSPEELATRVLEQQFRTARLASDFSDRTTHLRIERHLRAMAQRTSR